MQADRLTSLPREILLKIIYLTNDRTYHTLSIVCNKLFEFISNFNAEQVLQTKAFNKKAWEAIPKEPEKYPLLPLNISDVLNSSCPFNDNKKMNDTFALTLIPKITKEKIKELALKNFLQHGKDKESFSKEEIIIDQHFSDIPKPFWSLMYRGAAFPFYEDYKAFQIKFGKFRLPKPIEVLFSVIAHPRTKEETEYFEEDAQEGEEYDKEMSIFCPTSNKQCNAADLGSEDLVIALVDGSLSQVYHSANDADNILGNMQFTVVYEF